MRFSFRTRSRSESPAVLCHSVKKNDCGIKKCPAKASASFSSCDGSWASSRSNELLCKRRCPNSVRSGKNRAFDRDALPGVHHHRWARLFGPTLRPKKASVARFSRRTRMPLFSKSSQMSRIGSRFQTEGFPSFCRQRNGRGRNGQTG